MVKATFAVPVVAKREPMLPPVKVTAMSLIDPVLVEFVSPKLMLPPAKVLLVIVASRKVSVPLWLVNTTPLPVSEAGVATAMVMLVLLIVVVPPAPVAGQGWIIGTGATGVWAGHDDALAVWTVGGWRFVVPFVGMVVWSLADSMLFRRMASAWVAGALTGRTLTLDGVQVVGARGAAIAVPSGGAIIDIEARAVIADIVDRLRTHGLIAL